jgi:pyruvate dehydrogenase E2 component (dihydrolipoamide acetyltransferase)
VVTDVVLPQMGLEVSEGTVVTLHVAIGARVAHGDALIEVETDKALTDVVAPHDGVVLNFAVDVGDTVAVGATLVLLGDDDDASVAADDTAGADSEPLLAGVGAGPPRLRAAPVARRAAQQLGIALEEIAGTGPRGRITLGDVEQAARERDPGLAQPTVEPDTHDGGRLTPMSPTRRAIARRMTGSQAIPQFALHRDVEATWLLAEKARLAAAGTHKISVTDLLVAALAETVSRHPDLAASYVARDGEHPQLLVGEGVDVGLAVATDRGLLVPVIRGAHSRPIGELAADRARLVTAARDGRLEVAEMTGATVTLSSLAGFGVDGFTAMLNPGESAILAVGRTVDRVVARDRGLAVVPTVTLTFTFDHRAVDGASGARALTELADLLEGAMAWRT